MKKLLFLTLCACGPSQAQLDGMRLLFQAREPALAQAEQAFTAAAANRPPPRDGAACKTAFHQADLTQFAERLASIAALGTRGDGAFQAGNVTIFTPRSPLGELSSGAVAARRGAQKKILQREDEYADFNGKKLVAAAEKLAAEPLEAELLIEIAAAEDARPIDGKTFQAGMMLGRAWLYSLSEKRFVCAGTVVAASSKSVEIWQWKDSPRSNGKVEVAGDLYLNMVSEAEKSLKSL